MHQVSVVLAKGDGATGVITLAIVACFYFCHRKLLNYCTIVAATLCLPAVEDSVLPPSLSQSVPTHQAAIQSISQSNASRSTFPTRMHCNSPSASRRLALKCPHRAIDG